MLSPSRHHHLTTPHFFLYCEEDHWDTIPQELQQEEEEALPFGESPQLGHTASSSPNPLLQILGQDLILEDEELNFLLNKEPGNGYGLSFEGNPGLIEAREEAVEWMLKVVGYHSCSALTAILAVDYFDRFVRSLQSGLEKPWMGQLVAVACLSLAAKVEETQVPLLLDLQVCEQVEESKYVFDSKNIQRMELLILSTLGWRMNPVTPLSFLEFISRKLDLENHYCGEFLRRSQTLLLSVLTDCRFMKCPPSALATATMLYVISSLEPSIGLENQDKLAGILGINKDKVEECCEVIQQVARKRKLRAIIPGSPKGALDVSFSFNSDTSNESWSVTSSAAAAASVSSSPEPLSKKLKPQCPKDANI